MPKILNDVEHLIFEKAEELFGSRGYDSVDMKTLANACNIAVGTLYNYYPNKKELYLSVVIHGWKDTFEKLKQINITDDTKDYIHEVIEILYDDMYKRQGMGNMIMKGSLSGDKELRDVERFIHDEIKNTFKVIEKKNCFNQYNNIDDKLVFLIISMIITFTKVSPQDRDENISLIFEAVKVYYK